MAACKQRRTTDGADTNRAGPAEDSPASEPSPGLEMQLVLCCVAMLRQPLFDQTG